MIEWQNEFRVEVIEVDDGNHFHFGDKFIGVHTNFHQNPFISFVREEKSFLIWKSLYPNPAEIHKKLMQCEDYLQLFSSIDEPFLFIFFDENTQRLIYGKDFIGLGSLLRIEEPLTLATYGINGIDTPPGIYIHTPTSSTIEQYPVFTRTPTTPEDAVEYATDAIQTALVKSVVPGYPVLFSGGLDSTLLAASLGLRGTPKVQLINFCASPDAPDRESARRSVADLRTSFPNTQFELLELDGNIESMSREIEIIRQFLGPIEETEMNLNIAMTLYSALKETKPVAFHSGLGADELFCGYMKMRSGDDVAGQIDRLYERNGGRDDRVASFLGCVAIFPFLSKDLIEVARHLPASMLRRGDLGRGEGEKWILRQLAMKLGLKSAAVRPKQAMQFGSRVAKAKWRPT